MYVSLITTGLLSPLTNNGTLGALAVLMPLNTFLTAFSIRHDMLVEGGGCMYDVLLNPEDFIPPSPYPSIGHGFARDRYKWNPSQGP